MLVVIAATIDYLISVIIVKAYFANATTAIVVILSRVAVIVNLAVIVHLEFASRYQLVIQAYSLAFHVPTFSVA